MILTTIHGLLTYLNHGLHHTLHPLRIARGIQGGISARQAMPKSRKLPMKNGRFHGKIQ
jgi:hypothetical protein